MYYKLSGVLEIDAECLNGYPFANVSDYHFQIVTQLTMKGILKMTKRF